MIREPQDLADEFAAERCYADTTIPTVAAFDLFVDVDSRHDHLCRCPGCRPQPADEPAEPPFDVCTDGCHYARCGRYQPFERCRFGSHWHYVDDGLTAFRYVGKCPNASEYSEPAEQACKSADEDE